MCKFSHLSSCHPPTPHSLISHLFSLSLPTLSLLTLSPSHSPLSHFSPSQSPLSHFSPSHPLNPHSSPHPLNPHSFLSHSPSSSYSDVNQADSQGQGPLHLIASSGPSIHATKMVSRLLQPGSATGTELCTVEPLIRDPLRRPLYNRHLFTPCYCFSVLFDLRGTTSLHRTLVLTPC